MEKNLLGRLTDAALASLSARTIFTEVRPGVALPVGLIVSKNDAGGKATLVWIRVHNHVRKRGIGEAALCLMDAGTMPASIADLTKMHKPGKFDPEDPRFVRNYAWVKKTLDARNALPAATRSQWSAPVTSMRVACAKPTAPRSAGAVRAAAGWAMA